MLRRPPRATLFPYPTLFRSLDTAPLYGKDTPDEEISITKLLDELAEARKHNQSLQEVKGELEACREKDAICLRDMKVLQARHEEYLKGIANLEKEIEGQGPPMDTESLEANLSEAEEVNRRVLERKKLAVRDKLIKELCDESTHLSSVIDDVDKEKKKKIAESDIPIAGLDFDEKGVRFNGAPFSQASESDKLRIGMALAMAQNPKLRICLVRNGYALDAGNMERLAALAAEHDVQVWCERIEDKHMGFTIHEGEVMGE